MRQKAQSFLPGFNAVTAAQSHGGDLAKGRRKTLRPIDVKQALHVVMRSSIARGQFSMLRRGNAGRIHELTEKLARRWGVKLYRYANVGNHIHLLIQVPSRAAWRRFIRELSGGVAAVVTGAKKGLGLKPNDSGRGFWDDLVFTRIVRFGRDFRGVARYVTKNLFEAMGVPIKKLLSEGYRLLTITQEGVLSAAPP